MSAETSPRLRPSKRRVAAAALSVSLAGGVAIGVGLAISIAALNGWGASTDALLLALYLSALYSLVNGIGLGLVAGVALTLGKRPGPRVFAAILLAFYLFLNGALRFSQMTQLFSVTPHMNLVGIADAAVVTLAALVAAGAVLARRRAATAAGLAVAAALWVGLDTLNAPHERPRHRDLAAAVPAALAGAAPATPAPAAEPFGGTRLVVLGFDGLTWEVLLPLLKRGELPNFRAVLEDAAYGSLDTLPFSFSPVVWETIVTSQLPSRHGIGYHNHFAFPGTSDRVRFLPTHDLCQSWMGVRRLLAFTDGVAPWQQIQANATDARTARFWEIVARNGGSVGLYQWMNSAPAAPIDGFVHGYGVLEPLDFPSDLLEGLPPLPEPPDSGRPREGLEFIRSRAPSERAEYDRFVRLALRHRPEVLMYYTHFGDTANHMNWKRDTVGEGRFYAGLEHPEPQPGPAITTATRTLDGFVGDALARLPADATLVIVSDHGFDFRGYEHDNAPPGVLIVRGPGIQPGPFSGASLVDVTPTLLHLLRQPVADDMQGEVLPIFRPGSPLDYPTERVASYGPAAPAVIGGTPDPKALEEHEKYLRALGYVN